MLTIVPHFVSSESVRVFSLNYKVGNDERNFFFLFAFNRELGRKMRN